MKSDVVIVDDQGKGFSEALEAAKKTTEYDGYERSVLRKLADDIKVAIRGGVVDMTVVKKLAQNISLLVNGKVMT